MRTRNSGMTGKAGLLALSVLVLLSLGWSGLVQGCDPRPAQVQRFLYYFELTGKSPERLTLLERVTDTYLLTTSRFTRQ
jgi:hypothetical protein